MLRQAEVYLHYDISTINVRRSCAHIPHLQGDISCSFQIYTERQQCMGSSGNQYSKSPGRVYE